MEKPRLYMAYAAQSLSSKKHWVCDGEGIMSGGGTPQEAYKNWIACVYGMHLTTDIGGRYERTS